ncbi:gluconeogenesis factor YvcK family protein [Pseudonocardia pini]|uniref:gluconeogenesis factor YvcK family protein n=1 Tax=Pseudonocardia pini TaxID=2758030 RepID=UPI0015EFE558|nr:uridine diphosphate-N-acetylglucosamine-binding protein YvcK [Pseudonocardia pini]
MRAVALGGGHGLSATLSALRLMPEYADVTAVVTVADDGGSSGRIRRELGALLPPGDLRMALAALAGPDQYHARWAGFVQHRFGGTGALAGHAVGNLLLAGLMESLGDPVAALDEVCTLLGVRGRVLPMSRVPLDIEAEVSGLDETHPERRHRIRGQVAVASTPGRVERVWLHPEQPPACEQAVEAIRSADLVLLGPGSWFTSVLPHLLVPALRTALQETAARRVVVLNLAPEPGETSDFSPEQHLAVLNAHAPDLRLHAVLADGAAVPVPHRLRREARAMMEEGGRVHLAPVAAADPLVPRHEPAALAVALREVLATLPVGDEVVGSGVTGETDGPTGGFGWR